MKRGLLVLLSAIFIGLPTFAQQNITIRQLQQVPLDSLLRADTLQNSIPTRWTLQTSPYNGDTVTVTAICVVPAKVMTFTAAGFTMLLYDTAATSDWKGLFVRVNSPTDSAQTILDGFLNVEAGDMIRMTGLVSEFPTTSMNSLTQFQPIAGRPISIIGSRPVPSAGAKQIGDFYRGLFATGSVRFSTGEPFESMLVTLTNLTINFKVNQARGTFSAVDQDQNEITMYDASRYFTLGHGGTSPFPADSIWALTYPQIGVGTRIDTIRGFITTVSGSENPRGYRISPLYRGDIKFGITLPNVSQHRRNPVVVPSDSAARISVRAVKPTGGFDIATVNLYYSLNGAPFVTAPMTFTASDTTYRAQIPQQAENTFVNYFMRAVDVMGNAAILANSSTTGFSSDTSKGFFFYQVLNRPLTIRDLQYTPYLNGRSGYIGAVVSVKGIVTADTANIMLAPRNTGGTNAWYIQSTNQPWNGIWVVDSTMATRRNGDSITVTGNLVENFDVTRIERLSSPPTVHTTSNPLPAAVVQQTGTFGPNVGNGTPAAEQYEGMLVQFNNVTVTSIDPVFSDPTEFEVDDGSGPILVRRDGTHMYSNVAADSAFGFTILRVGNRISSLKGVMYYSFNRYKICPRRASDFGTITSVREIDHDPGVPASYALGQNYPNPFNPTTTITYQLPVAGFTTLSLYNIMGQEVQSLVSEEQSAGTYTVRINASSLASGVYFYRLTAGRFSESKKMLLLK